MVKSQCAPAQIEVGVSCARSLGCLICHWNPLAKLRNPIAAARGAPQWERVVYLLSVADGTLG